MALRVVASVAAAPGQHDAGPPACYAADMAVLPPRPWTIDRLKAAELDSKSTTQVMLLWLSGALAALGALYLGQAVVSERLLWSRGVPGEVVSRSDRVEPWGLFGVTLAHRYRGAIEYADQAGARWRLALDFDYVGVAAEPATLSALRYDPAEPSQATLEAQGAGGWPRWSPSALLVLLAVLVLRQAMVTQQREAVRRRLTDWVVDDGEELLAELVDLTAVSGACEVTYKHPESRQRVTVTLPVEPLVVDGEAGAPRQVVLLRSPRAPSQPLVLRHDLAPFVTAAPR